MICWLKGNIKVLDLDSVMIVVNNIGYSIKISRKTATSLPDGSEAEFFIYEHIREDDYSLYGFATREELLFFKLILAVKGIGPKIALSLLSEHSPSELATAINCEELSILTNVSGIGMKSAQRIILELKGKMSNFTDLSNYTASSQLNNSDGELIAALQNLGYNTNNIQLILSKIPGDEDISTRLKLALQELS